MKSLAYTLYTLNYTHTYVYLKYIFKQIYKPAELEMETKLNYAKCYILNIYGEYIQFFE